MQVEKGTYIKNSKHTQVKEQVTLVTKNNHIYVNTLNILYLSNTSGRELSNSFVQIR